MPDINQVIDSLSSEELDLLNSDPELLGQFKAKYTGSAPAMPVNQTQPTNPGVLSKTLDVLGTPGRGIAALAFGAGQIGQQPLAPTIQKMAEITQPGFQPQNTAESAANVAGTLTNLAVPVGAALQGGKKVLEATNVGNIIKGALRGTSALGREAQALKQSAGIPVNETTKVLGAGAKQVEKAVNSVKDTAQLLDLGIDVKDPAILAQLNRDSQLAGQLLDRGAKVVGGKDNFAAVAQAKAKIQAALGKGVPGLEDVNVQQRAAYLRNKALKGGLILGAGKEFVLDPILSALRGN